MQIAELYELYLKHPIICPDSRNVKPGSLFFGLKGGNFDGNRFALQALNSDCAFAVVDDPSIEVNDRIIQVEDTLATLQQLAHHHREKMGIPVIGITGTNGKTTTKELLGTVLSSEYQVLYTQGNLNNHIGVPLTLLQLTSAHQLAVIEMGANHPGEIRTLAEIADPDLGLITNVGYAHLEGFGSFEGVIQTKGELYDYLRKKNGTIFLHIDNQHLSAIAGGLKCITYGESSEADISGHVIPSHPFLSFQWKKGNENFAVDTHLVGFYNLPNALAAVAVATYFNIEASRINTSLANYQPNNNRSQWKKTDRNELIIDAYNANPSSMQAALANFASLPAASKAVILGDMRELGNDSQMLHREIVELLNQYQLDQVLLCGEEFSKAKPPFPCFGTVEDLNQFLSANPLQGYHILLKGSNGIHLERTLDFL